MRARWTIGLATAALVGVTAMPAVAWQLEPGDRGLLHAYSPEALELLWGSVEVEDETVCEIEAGQQYTYLSDGDQVTVFDGEAQVLTDDCDLTATDVQGPQGQVNHGTVVSSFVHALKEAGYGPGIGCFVSAIARTDYGKGDQQLRPGESPETASGTPTVDFTITATSCVKDTSTEPESAEESQSGPPAWVKERRAERDSAASSGDGKGKPDWAGPPPHAKGKSENGGPPPHARGNGKSR